MDKYRISAGRAKRCLTHHACDCSRWKIEQMAMALRIIHTWASCDHLSHQTREQAMADIQMKCKEILDECGGP